MSWFEDNYHRIEALVSHGPDEWVVRHHGPPRLGDTLHDWLHQDPVRKQTEIEWQSRGTSSRTTPW